MDFVIFSPIPSVFIRLLKANVAFIFIIADSFFFLILFLSKIFFSTYLQSLGSRIPSFMLRSTEPFKDLLKAFALYLSIVSLNTSIIGIFIEFISSSRVPSYYFSLTIPSLVYDSLLPYKRLFASLYINLWFTNLSLVSSLIDVKYFEGELIF